MTWAARLRGTAVPQEFTHLKEVLARHADGPVSQYRALVDEVVSGGDRIPAALAAGEHLDLTTTLTLAIDDEVLEAFRLEMRRQRARYEIDDDDDWAV